MTGFGGCAVLVLKLITSEVGNGYGREVMQCMVLIVILVLLCILCVIVVLSALLGLMKFVSAEQCCLGYDGRWLSR